MENRLSFFKHMKNEFFLRSVSQSLDGDAIYKPYRRLIIETCFNLEESGTGVCLMLTCPSSSNATAQVTLDLAEFLAEKQGRKVLIVDATHKAQQLSKYFGASSEPGLLDLLAQESKKDTIIQPTNHLCLYFMSAGRVDQGQIWLLTSNRLKNSLAILRQQFDFILLNSPSILSDPGTLAFPSIVDCVLLLGIGGYTKKHELVACRRALRNCKAKKIGLLFVRP